jgi:hypothetical protein
MEPGTKQEKKGIEKGIRGRRRVGGCGRERREEGSWRKGSLEIKEGRAGLVIDMGHAGLFAHCRSVPF